jgi:TolB-like protein/lipoprotein NlpI
LSYASQDAEAARRICDALRQAGVEVWFDQSELRGGDAWDQKIRQQIRDCALFVPIISAHTSSRPEGYFRLEWGIADQRTQMIARNKAFIVPVCVDATPDTVADLPESFMRVQWTRLPGGATPPAFGERIAALLRGPDKPADRHTRSGPGLVPAVASAPKFARWMPIVIAAVLLTGVIALRPWRLLASKPAAASANQIDATAAAVTGSTAPERSIAVLPFTDMSEKKDQEYFSDGLSEELIDMLAKVPDLRVPARTSSFYFKDQHATIAEIAKALGVSHLLEGSVRKAGNTVRVTAQLIRADNGYHLWSQTYDRDAKDIFKVQDDIAVRVVEELKLSLPATSSSNARGTENTAAYNQYLLGKKLLDQPTPDSFRSAIEAFKSAVALDPDYAAAYSRLGLAEAGLADLTGDSTGLTRATAAAERAITLAPASADGYFARAYVRSNFLWDWDGASADFKKALAIDANNPDILLGYSQLLATKGNLAEALAAVDKAIQIDPLFASLYSLRGRLLMEAGYLPAARDAYQQLLKINPAHPHANVDLAGIDLLQGHADQALLALQKPAEVGWRRVGTAMVEYSLGDLPASQHALDDLVRDSAQFAAYQIAMIHAWRGEKDQAFQWLDRAYDQHDGGLSDVKTDPFIASLRADVRYRALLEKMKLPLQ